MSRRSRDGGAISSEDFAARKELLDLTDEDSKLLRRLAPSLKRSRAELVDRFYEHLQRFPETRALLSNPDTVRRLRDAQSEYLDRLCSGDYGNEYAEDRLRVGATHHRIGVEPKWYLGAFALYVRLLLPEVWRATEGSWEQALPVIEALLKVVFLDLGIAVDTYRNADRRHILDLKRFNDRVVASMPSGLLVVDDQMAVVAVNRSFTEACACKRDALVGRSIMEVLGAPELEPHLREVLATDDTRGGLLVTARCAETGAARPVRVTVTGIELAEEEEEEEEERLLVVVEDLTQEALLEGRARALEQRFREVVETATDGIVLMEVDGLVSYFNAAAERMFGWRRDEVIGKPVTRLMPEKYRQAHEAGVARFLAEGGSSRMGTVRVVEGLRKDGSAFPIECTLSAYRTDGRVIFTGVLRDVTERQRAEQALRRSEASFRALIEGSPDAVFVHRDGRLVYASHAALTCLGYESAEDLIGRPLLEVIHPDDRSPVAARLAELGATGQALPAHEERFLRRDGSTVFAEVVGIPIVFEGAPAFAAIARDVTERRQLTARMMQMDRMIAVGTLAAGVGHEINNPLTYVVANVDYALQKLPQTVAAARRLTAADSSSVPTSDAAMTAVELEQQLVDLQRILEEAREGGDRVRKIVRDLAMFSRVAKEQLEPVNVHYILESAINMAWNEIRHRARLVKDYGQIPRVLANESRLGQVFLNLLVNAAHAVPEGHAEANEIRVRTGAEGDSAFIEVRDTGCGVPPEAIPRIFDAFFTTKPVGQGTGLGLAICQNIVSALGGTIHVESEVGKGSAFRVVLPAADPAVVPNPPVPRSPVPTGRRGRVLIIDDESLVAGSIQRVLRSDHDVVCVTRGREAFELLAGGARFDVILCDLMMPEMSGMEIHEQMVGSFPEQAERMIFLTGGAFTPRAREFLEQVPNQRLEKPFDIRNIQALLRQLVR